MSKEKYNSPWKIIVKALDGIQEEALSAKSAESLIALLLEKSSLNQLVSRQDISVIYQNYGAEKPEFWATPTGIRKRLLNSNGTTKSIDPEPKSDFSSDHPLIKEVMETGEIISLQKLQECNERGLSYKSFLIVPMSLNKSKIVGVFVLHNKEKEDAYDNEFVQCMDTLSNRLAYFMRHNIRKRRNIIFQDIQNNLLSNKFETEGEILNSFTQALLTWFEYDDAIILLKHPLRKDQLVLASESKKEFEIHSRSINTPDNYLIQPSLTKDSIRNYLGDTETLLNNRPLCLNTKKSIEKNYIGINCYSWLGTPMRLKKGVNLGYLLLFNKDAEHAFDTDEDRFVDSMSDFLASLIATFRQQQFNKILRYIRDYSLETDRPEFSLQSLYKTVSSSLKQLYGIQDLLIARYSRSDLGFTLEHCDEGDNDAQARFNKVSFKALEVVQSSDKERNLDPNKLMIEVEESGGREYFIAPMRIIKRSVGCFIFKAEKIGNFTAQSIDDLADELGRKVSNYERWMRYAVLNDFGRVVNQRKVNSQSDIINMAVDHISKAMYTKNFYIALYNKKEDSIFFPFALEGGKTWAAIEGKTRTIDDQNLGKTEWIIRNNSVLFHRTKADALDWYSQLNHKEHGGNPLASWVGVPVFSEQGTIGVIATYHDKLDYIYSERDIFFLQNISNQVSGLFRALDLTNANEKILQYESQLQKNLNARDISHRMKGSLSSISIKTKHLIERQKTASPESITKNLNSIKETAESLLKSATQISQTSKEEIKVLPFLNEIVQQVSNEFLINNIDVKAPEQDIRTRQDKRSLFHIIHSLLTNSCEATSSSEDAKIIVSLENKGSYFSLTVKDNGSKISKEAQKRLFQLGFSTKKTGEGYALWRAKNYAKKSKGDLDFFEENEFQCFQLTLPSETKMPLAYIVDDQRIWREILSEWLGNIGYKVKSSKDYVSARDLFSQGEIPDLITLDIGLDPNSIENREGLKLIKYARDTFSRNIKIALVTSYPESTDEYKGEIDFMFKKSDDNGLPLDNKYFINVVENL